MKILEEIWKEFDTKNGKLSEEALESLIWGIKNNPLNFISPATDIINESSQYQYIYKRLTPVLAIQLKNKDAFIREHTVTYLVGLLGSHEYGGKALDLALYDPEESVRISAVSSLGSVMNKVDKKLEQRMAFYLYQIITSNNSRKFCRDKIWKICAQKSILNAMNIPYSDWGTVNFKDIWKDFLEKYHLPEKEVVRVEKGQ